jgi:hypothetical protein
VPVLDRIAEYERPSGGFVLKQVRHDRIENPASTVVEVRDCLSARGIRDQ